jgi:hypothetical protein
VIDAPKSPWIIRKKSRGISPVPGFQFWPNSESLGLNEAQLQEQEEEYQTSSPDVSFPDPNIYFKDSVSFVDNNVRF